MVAIYQPGETIRVGRHPGGVRLAGGGGFAGAYDAIPSIAAAYGMRRLRSAYTGSLLRLRRGSDNVESNFGYTGAGDLDAAAIATWLGAATGLDTTLYDEAGSRNATQSTAASQPTFAASAQNGKPGLQFATNDWLDLSNAATPLLPATADWAVYGVIRTGAQVTATETILAQYLAAINNGRVSIRVDGGNLSVFLGSEAGGLTSQTVVAGAVSINTTYVFNFRRVGNSFCGRLNGVDGTALNEASQRSLIQTGNLIGGRGSHALIYNDTISDLLNGHLLELAVQVATPSTGDMAAMDSALNAYWGVYV